MFEPFTLSVTQLAERWKLSPRQIIEQAIALRVPLYFPFEGLAYDLWADPLAMIDEREANLRHSIAQHEQMLLEYQPGHHNPEDTAQWRQSVNEWQHELERLHRERNALRYNGYVRIGLGSLLEMLRAGHALHPARAFRMEGRVRAVQDSEGRIFWDGPEVRLEPSASSKPRLAMDDLVAFMAEVKAIEDHATEVNAEPGVTTTEPDVAEAPMASELVQVRVAWRVILQDRLSEIDAAHGGKASVMEVIRWLRRNGGPRIVDEGASDKLTWIDDYGGRQEVEKKTVSNALRDLRAAREAPR